MHDSISPEKGECCCRCLEHKIYGGLAYIQEVRRLLIRELHELLNEKISFEIGELGALLTHFQTKSNLIDRLKQLMRDEQLYKIQDELELGKAPSFVVGEDGLSRLSFCVLEVNDLKRDTMTEA